MTDTGQLSAISPVLISGVYRSGTTFLAAMVNRIPGVEVASSTVKYLRIIFPRYNDLSEAGVLDTVLEETRKRLKIRWELDLDIAAVRSLLPDESPTHAQLYDALMSVLTLQDTASTRWGEKVNAQWRQIEQFLGMFPEGRVLHVYRDPRDVTASYKKMTYEPWPTFMDAALNCKGAMREVPALQKRFGKDRILMLRAEDMASDLASQMATICEFLGEDFDPSLADLASVGDLKGEDWRGNTSFGADAKNFSQAKPRWPDNLTAEEILLVELICQPEMAQLGYAGSGNPLARVDWKKFGELLADDWLSGRIEHYLTGGAVLQGYRSDPVKTELAAVSGEK